MAAGIERCQVIGGQSDVGSGDIIDQLLLLVGTDNDAGHDRLVEQPGQCDLRDRHAMALGDGPHRDDDRNSAIPVDRWEVEGGTAPADTGFFTTIIFSRQKPAGQWTPDHEADLLRLHHRDQFAFEVAPGNGIIGLEAFDPSKMLMLGNTLRLHDLQCSPVRNTDVTAETGLHQTVHGAHRFFNRRRRVKAMNLVQVDVIHL